MPLPPPLPSSLFSSIFLHPSHTLNDETQQQRLHAMRTLINPSLIHSPSSYRSNDLFSSGLPMLTHHAHKIASCVQLPSPIYNTVTPFGTYNNEQSANIHVCVPLGRKEDDNRQDNKGDDNGKEWEREEGRGGDELNRTTIMIKMGKKEQYGEGLKEMKEEEEKETRTDLSEIAVDLCGPTLLQDLSSLLPLLPSLMAAWQPIHPTISPANHCEEMVVIDQSKVWECVVWMKTCLTPDRVASLIDQSEKAVSRIAPLTGAVGLMECCQGNEDDLLVLAQSNTLCTCQIMPSPTIEKDIYDNNPIISLPSLKEAVCGLQTIGLGDKEAYKNIKGLIYIGSGTGVSLPCDLEVGGSTMGLVIMVVDAVISHSMDQLAMEVYRVYEGGLAYPVEYSYSDL